MGQRSTASAVAGRGSGRRPPTVLIVGAGVIGLSVAVSLQRRGWEVIVLDDQLPGAASAAAAGILFPTSAQRSSGLAGKLSLQAVELWPQWAESLGGALLRAGGISFFADQDSEQDLATIANNIGLPEPTAPSAESDCPGWAYLSPEARRRVSAGLHLPAGLAVDPGKLLVALGQKLRVRTLIKDRAQQLLTSGSRASGIIGRSGQRYQADVLIAAPGSAPVDWLPSELRPKITSLVGEALVLETDFYRYGPAAIYPFTSGPLSSRPGQVWLGGSYRPEEGRQYPRLDSLQEIINRGVEIFPELASARVKKFLYGRRPVTADHLPVVGPSELPGLYWAGGHGKDGILHSSLIGQQLLDWLENDRGYQELLPKRLGPE